MHKSQINAERATSSVVLMSFSRKAVSTSRVALVIVIIVAVIFAGIYFASRQSAPVTTTTVSPIPETLVIDDNNWPVHDLNALYQIQTTPIPHWQAQVTYQTLIVPNVTAEFKEGKIQFIPDLATDWKVTPDGMTYTFNLRQGVKFSNGDSFNAYHVWTEMYTWYYLNGNGTNFLGSVDLFDASHVNFGAASFDLLKSTGLTNPTGEALRMMQDQSWPIYTTNPYQVVFHLKHPFLFLEGLLVGFQGFIFDCQYVLDNGGVGTPAQYNPYFNEHPIPGTGPYMVTEVVLNSHATFEKNPNYWGASLTADQIAANKLLNPGVVKRVILRWVADDLSRYTDLTTGDAQIAAVLRTNWNLVITNPRLTYWSVPVSPILQAIPLNTRLAPTDNVNVRRAIVHAINYTDIWMKASLGQAGPVVGPETPNFGVFYNPGNLPPYDYNLNKARDYLVKAGYPGGEGLPPLSFRTVAGCTYCTAAAEIVQHNLRDIGINVIIQDLAGPTYWTPFGDYATNVKNAKDMGNMMFIGSRTYAPDYLAPPNFWSAFVSNDSLWGNFAAYSNPTVNNAVRLLSSSTDVSQIVAALTAAQAQIQDDAPYAWIGYSKLWMTEGSFVWDRNLIKEVMFEPNFGVDHAPMFNTVVFVSQT